MFNKVTQPAGLDKTLVYSLGPREIIQIRRETTTGNFTRQWPGEHPDLSQ